MDRVVDLDRSGVRRQGADFTDWRQLSGAAEVLLIADPQRDVAPEDRLAAVIAAVRAGHDAVAPVRTVSDTVKRVDAAGVVHATVPRDRLRTVESPVGVRAAAVAEWDITTATTWSELLNLLQYPVWTVDGSSLGFPATEPADATGRST